ncbi:uncharacterized protein LOC111370198 [Olea europaea var. sylvestris]|uniref:uncharacterized protein LOC111370198 n=1 Tax=Olea europaea var. sylvestris TaxID=158386 RepID=UPI000C1D8AC4|nr:uncharacterized protein LOC111370198 [Olea europaea var. sylvestris]
MAQAAHLKSRTIRREMDTMNGRLSVYMGRMDGIQLRLNETWERTGHTETNISEFQAEIAQQSAMMREILAHPSVFNQWVSDMDRFFAWYGVPKDRRVQFASLKLTGTAQLFWENVEDLLERRHAPPVGSWDEMKSRLQEKYLPQSYRGNLLDQWNTLTQGSRPVTEYVSQFDEFRMKRQVVEDEAMTWSRLRQGQRDDLRRELILRGVTTLDHPYSFVRDYELETRTPNRNRSDSRTTTSSASTPSPKSILGPPPSNTTLTLDSKGRGSELSRTSSRLQCFNCKGFGHISSKCPSRALVMEEHEGIVDEPLEDQVYEPKLEEFDVLEDSEDTFLGCIQASPLIPPYA